VFPAVGVSVITGSALKSPALVVLVAAEAVERQIGSGIENVPVNILFVTLVRLVIFA
jgi:hypothetical protein